MKVTVLYDLWEEEPVEVQEEAPPPRKRKGPKKRKKKPVKHDREEIFEALEKLGHEPSYYVLDGRPQSLVGLAKCGADLIFNRSDPLRISQGSGITTKGIHQETWNFRRADATNLTKQTESPCWQITMLERRHNIFRHAQNVPLK